MTESFGSSSCYAALLSGRFPFLKSDFISRGRAQAAGAANGSLVRKADLGRRDAHTEGAQRGSGVIEPL